MYVLFYFSFSFSFSPFLLHYSLIVYHFKKELLREIIQLKQPSTVTLPIINNVDDGDYLEAIAKLLEIIRGEEAELEQLRPKSATTPTAEHVAAFREMFSSPNNTGQASPILSAFTDSAATPPQMNISQNSPEPIVAPEPEHENDRLTCIDNTP